MNSMGSNSKFEDLMKEGDVRNYLKASPLASGERSGFDRELTEDYYYSKLYAHSEEAGKLIQEIEKRIIYDDTHNFIFSGYKGCGKSTFIRYFLRETNIRNIMINFDDNWEPNVGIKKNIVMNLNNKIYNDLFPKNGEVAGRVSRKYLDIFYFDENNKNRLKEIDMNHYFSYFSDKLAYAYRCKSEGRNDDLARYYESDIVKHTISGSISEMLILLVFWDISEKFEKNWKNLCCIVFENLDVIYNTSDVPNMIQNVVAFRNNIDKICQKLYYQDNPIGNPTQDYLLMFVMRETTKAEFSSCIDHFSDGKVRFASFPDVSEIYKLYDIVKQRYKYVEELLMDRPEYKEITSYIKLYEVMKLLKMILKEPYLQKNLFQMLNNDYRTSAELLGSFNFNDENFIKVCNRMKTFDKDTQGWSKFGFRSIFFREVFNLFVKEGYFGKIRKFEYTICEKGNKCGVNIDRMILLYLNNSCDLISKGNLQEKEFVSVDVLFNEIRKFCNNSELIVDALWQMYDLRKEDKWNHLVTFDNMQNITHEELKKEMKALEDKQTDYHFAKVKITKSGEIYLDYILTHFEYYAARCGNGKGSSLFLMDAEEICNENYLDNILKDELKEIKECCKRLFYFFTDVLDKKDEFKKDKFLNTKFATIKVLEKRNSITRMFHCEQIIYSNIGYLNRFRFYAFKMLDDVLERGGFEKDINVRKLLGLLSKVDSKVYENWPKEIRFQKISRCVLQGKGQKKADGQWIHIVTSDAKKIDVELPLDNVITVLKACLNVRLIDGIISFMAMFGFHKGNQCTVYSDGTPKICGAFDACINQIGKAKFLDFTTPIDFTTGEKIIANMKRTEKQEQHKSKNKLG